MRYLLTLLLASVLFTGCTTLQIENDYDTSVNFGTYKTFAIVATKAQEKEAIDHKRIVRAITRNLESKGFGTADKQNADLLIVYITNVKSQKDIRKSYEILYGYGYRGGGMVVTNTETFSYKEGSLVLDVSDRKKQEVIYRAKAVDRLKTLKTPQERSAYISGVIDEALKGFPPGSGQP